jgi:hypothetical protein
MLLKEEIKSGKNKDQTASDEHGHFEFHQSKNKAVALPSG